MSLKQGKKKEVEFSKLFKDVVFADKNQDMNEHWDVCVKYDVKSIKRKDRGGDVDENYHWVEIKNVNGDQGWLYGKADYFAFEIEDYWIIVCPDRLKELVSEKCSGTSYSPSLHRFYTRNGRKDVITMVKSIDLLYIASEIIKK